MSPCPLLTPGLGITMSGTVRQDFASVRARGFTGASNLLRRDVTK
jgi:hypothetical protein